MQHERTEIGVKFFDKEFKLELQILCVTQMSERSRAVIRESVSVLLQVFLLFIWKKKKKNLEFSAEFLISRMLADHSLMQLRV